VLHYLSEPEVKALLGAVVAHFPGGQLIFDICNPFVVKRTGSNVGGTGASYKWGLDDPHDIKQLEPKLELIKEFRPSEQVAFPDSRSGGGPCTASRRSTRHCAEWNGPSCIAQCRATGGNDAVREDIGGVS